MGRSRPFTLLSRETGRARPPFFPNPLVTALDTQSILGHHQRGRFMIRCESMFIGSTALILSRASNAWPRLQLTSSTLNFVVTVPGSGIRDRTSYLSWLLRVPFASHAREANARRTPRSRLLIHRPYGLSMVIYLNRTGSSSLPCPRPPCPTFLSKGDSDSAGLGTTTYLLVT